MIIEHPGVDVKLRNVRNFQSPAQTLNEPEITEARVGNAIQSRDGEFHSMACSRLWPTIGTKVTT